MNLTRRYADWTRRQCSQCNCLGPQVTSAIAVGVVVVACVIYSHRTGFHQFLVDAAYAFVSLAGLVLAAGVTGAVIRKRRQAGRQPAELQVSRPDTPAQPAAPRQPVEIRRPAGIPGAPAGRLLASPVAGRPADCAGDGCGRPAAVDLPEFGRYPAGRYCTECAAALGEMRDEMAAGLAEEARLEAELGKRHAAAVSAYWQAQEEPDPDRRPGAPDPEWDALVQGLES